MPHGVTEIHAMLLQGVCDWFLQALPALPEAGLPCRMHTPKHCVHVHHGVGGCQ